VSLSSSVGVAAWASFFSSVTLVVSFLVLSEEDRAWTMGEAASTSSITKMMSLKESFTGMSSP
jgi:hypothetical protein